MTMRAWIRHVFTRRAARPVRKPSFNFRPCLEGLEQRLTPAIATPILAALPVISSSTASLAVNAPQITIDGTGFDPNPAGDHVTFNDGAVGSISAASPTSLTVKFAVEPAIAGLLMASVVSDGHSSGSQVSVATVVPVLTGNTANLAANVPHITINGLGFNPAIPASQFNKITFSNGAVGVVTAATATELTVSLSTEPTSTGSLTAKVTTNGEASATVQVATIVAPPSVTQNIANLPAGATTITIAGTGFAPTPAGNSVAFNDGAVGAITAASSTSLTVSFSTPPTVTGNVNLTAIVTSNEGTSGNPVQVATLAPVVTPSTGALPADSATVIINGAHFDPTLANNKVVFTDGAVGAVTAASSTSLTVTFSTMPVTAGLLTAVVTTDNHSSGAAVSVATVTPVVTASTANLSTTASQITIHGFGFDPSPSKNTITFNNGAVGNITSASPTSITVTFTTKQTGAGNLTAVVTTDLQSSGAAVQVATVPAPTGGSPGATGYWTGFWTWNPTADQWFWTWVWVWNNSNNSFSMS